MPYAPVLPDSDWTGGQLVGRFLALAGAVPTSAHHILFRSTSFADGREISGYQLPGETVPVSDAAVRAWMIRQDLAGDAIFTVSVLVIREVLDGFGAIRECVLEWRLGRASGPLWGNPARIEFAGPARHVRRYRALRNGRLAELAPAPFVPSPRAEMADAAEDALLRGQFGAALLVLDRRRPTLFEAMVGLGSILHLRLPDGREVGCGIGWHGPLAFCLVADFSRLAEQPELAPDDEAQIARALADHDLERHELRFDSEGPGVMARQRDGAGLFVIRPGRAAPRVEPFLPSPDIVLTDDQRRWRHYAETYEQRRILDGYRALSGETVIVTADSNRHVWRHLIDSDGVELSCAPADDCALAAVLGADPPPPPAAPAAGAAPSPTGPRHMLALSRDVSRLLSTLETLRSSDGAAMGQGLRALLPSLRGLGLRLSQTAAYELLRRVELGLTDLAEVARALDTLQRRLVEELTAQEVALATGPWPAEPAATPFGEDLAAAFPATAYHIAEAVTCLALRRPTAAVLHAMQILRRALASRLPGATAAGSISTWPALLASLRALPGAPYTLVEAAEALRRSWLSPDLLPADKYTEAEAEAVLTAVADLLRALAATERPMA